MKYLEKHPMTVIVVGIVGISLSAIFVRYSVAPSAVLAAWRLLWSVILMTPVVLGSATVRRELIKADKKSALFSALSGAFLAAHAVMVGQDHAVQNRRQAVAWQRPEIRDLRRADPSGTCL